LLYLPIPIEGDETNEKELIPHRILPGHSCLRRRTQSLKSPISEDLAPKQALNRRGGYNRPSDTDESN